MAQFKRRSYDLLLGSFVAIGLLVLLVLVFVIGKERRLFDRTVAIYTYFQNVAGLAVGADVLLSGRVVGRVKAINFPLLTKDKEQSRDMTVAMEISHQYVSWIREDSIARIDSKGLLGDKLINISIGSVEFNEVPFGGIVKSAPPLDLTKAMEKAQGVLEGISDTVAEAKKVFRGFSDEGGGESLASSIKSISRILREVETGDGVAHALIYDHTAGSRTKSAIGNLNKISTDLALILDEIKGGSGIAHDLIYADNNGQMIRSLNKAAQDIETVVADIKSGKGSVGLLLRDPSLYNELYGLIGNLRRNRLLKAVIRHGVSQSEERHAE